MRLGLRARWALSVCVLLPALVAWRSLSPMPSSESSLLLSSTTSVILLTAHPDDETFFFSPTLHALAHSATMLICFSTGDALGQGATRTAELRASCQAYGIPEHRCHIVDDPLLRDGMHTTWPLESIQEHVYALLSSLPTPSTGATDTVAIVTFDAQGVSGHPNHRALFAAVASPSFRPPTTAYQTQVWALRSVSFALQFSWPWSAPFDLFARWRATRDPQREVLLGGRAAFSKARKSWREHKSQKTWYRSLNLASGTGRFLWVNDLRRVR